LDSKGFIRVTETESKNATEIKPEVNLTEMNKLRDDLMPSRCICICPDFFQELELFATEVGQIDQFRASYRLA
jgi:hypothetical protein